MPSAGIYLAATWATMLRSTGISACGATGRLARSFSLVAATADPDNHPVLKKTTVTFPT
jgi:hypothetical protein